MTPGVTSPVGTSTTTSYANTGLSPSTTYSYRVAAVDKAGNIGHVSSQVSKTTAASTASTDKTPPTVTSTSPASGATGVVITSPVKATFSEPVQSWSSSTIFSVKNGAGTSFSGTIALSTDKKTVTFSHSSPFAPSTSYTVTITTGVKDSAGNAMTSTKTWSFTTAASSAAYTTPPSVKITSPANNSPATSNTIKTAGTSADSGSGVKNVMVRIRAATTTTGYTLATPKAAGDWSTWSASLSLSSAGSTGPYTLEARAEDNAGNMQWSDDVVVNYSPSSSPPPPSSGSDFSDSFHTVIFVYSR